MPAAGPMHWVGMVVELHRVEEPGLALAPERTAAGHHAAVGHLAAKVRHPGQVAAKQGGPAATGVIQRKRASAAGIGVADYRPTVLIDSYN